MVNLKRYRLIRERCQRYDSPERDALVGIVYSKLMEIESRLLPCGLHVIGKPPTASEAIATLVNISSLDRSEEEILSLPRIIANSIGRNIGQVYQNSDHGILEDVQLLQDIPLPRGSGCRPCQSKQMLMVVSPKSPSSTFNMGKKSLGLRHCTGRLPQG